MPSAAKRSATGIEDLPLDCMLCILDHLTLLERVKIESVSNWLRSVLWHSYARSIGPGRAFDMATWAAVVDPSEDAFRPDSLIYEPMTIGLVRRLGAQATKVSFGRMWARLTEDVVQTVVDCCHRVDTLDLSASIIACDLSAILAPMAGRIRRLHMDEVQWLKEEHAEGLCRLVASMRVLERLSLRMANFACDTLGRLPADMSHLDIVAARQIPEAALIEFLMTRQPGTLTELRASYFHMAMDATVELICGAESLTTLELAGPFGSAVRRTLIGWVDPYRVDLASIGRLRNLQHLHLQNNRSVDTAALESICASLHQTLRTLDVENCMLLREVTAISRLRQLTSLTVGMNVYVDDECCARIAHGCGGLRALCITQCINVTAVGLGQFAQLCAELRQLTVKLCDNAASAGLTSTVCSGLASARPRSAAMRACDVRDDAVLAMGQSVAVWIDTLRELDLSYNRYLTDAGVLKLHAALQLAAGGERAAGRRLVLYMHSTKVKRELIPLVADQIELVI